MAARGLDVDDVDVVIQCGCRHLDSFVHRAGRTARRGKSGTNILFISKEELKFATELERKLNISFRLANQLTTEEDEGNFFEKFSSHAESHKGSNHKEASAEISEALVNMKLEDSKRHDEMVRYLIDFYVAKNFKKVEPVGFLSGRAQTTTYGLYGAQ